MPPETNQSVDYSLTLETVSGLSYHISRPLLTDCGIAVIFTTRKGGVSLGPYASLNLALHVGDDSGDVLQNREAICRLFNLDPARMTCAEQVHGAEVAVVEETDVGAGARSFDDAIKGVDALVSACTRSPLTLFFADCMPVVLVEPQRRLVGVVHAGWRGVYANTIGNAVEAMVRAWSISSDGMVAFIGPSIGGCCYRVSTDMIGSFRARFEENREWLRGDKIDLRAIGRSQLMKSGIQPASIYACKDCCTACHSDIFFSYRADSGTTGRQAAMVAIL